MTPAEAYALHQPWQDEWELTQLTLFLQQIWVDVIVEIGTHRGGSTRYWQEMLAPSLVVTVDREFPLGEIGDAVGVFGRASQHPETVRQVREAVGERDVDMLFIDGGHSYPEVWGDYEAYGKLVRPGGTIVLHDVAAGVSTSPQGCHAALVWDEIVRKGGNSVCWRHGQGTGAIIV